MENVIYIGSEMELLFNEQDFVNLVGKYMGRDARNNLNSIITQRDEALKYVGEYDAGYEDGYEEGWNDCWRSSKIRNT